MIQPTVRRSDDRHVPPALGVAGRGRRRSSRRARGPARRADGQARVQPRHPADPGGELLRLPRAGQRRAQGRPAARPAARRPSRPGRSSPGDPEESELIARIHSDDPNEVMPPPTSQQDADRRAEGRRCSAGSPRGPSTSRTGRSSRPTRPEPPGGQGRGVGPQPDRPLRPGRSSRSEGLTPAPEADRRTLARRLSLDLTGLPPDARPTSRRSSTTRRPTPTRSSSTGCWHRRSWGEHRGRYWLDAARYADTHGIHFDNYREMWAYRDWVIDAFNRNMPFDQFTIEQLAGDLLPEPDARPADRLRLQPLQHHDQRGRARSPRSTSSSTPATAPRPSRRSGSG